MWRPSLLLLSYPKGENTCRAELPVFPGELLHHSTAWTTLQDPTPGAIGQANPTPGITLPISRQHEGPREVGSVSPPSQPEGWTPSRLDPAQKGHQLCGQRCCRYSWAVGKKVPD